MIDLRSDTVTKPDHGMRVAMSQAEVGDDVFGEDPTVRQLEERIADLLGKEAGLFVPTGVMGNQLALRTHTAPGDEVIVERTSHIFNSESGAAPALSGIQLNPVDGVDGLMRADQIRERIRDGYYWETPTRLVCLENTLNKAGGRVPPQDLVLDIKAVADEHGLAMHLDGARLWNAAVASNVEPNRLAEPFASVNVCLSKGLGAPVGSVLVGDRDFITRAHRFRKMYGGGMRQVGILAAAGLYALDHNFERLADDHRNARTLAEGLAGLSTVRLDPRAVETNIVIFDVPGHKALDIVSRLREAGVLVVPFGPFTIRATTHKDVDSDEIERALPLMASVLG